MADYKAEDLVEDAKKRFGESVLRDRMVGAEGEDEKDLELFKIALSVINRVEAAAMASVGWPLKGKWPSGSLSEEEEDLGGTLYREKWPYDLKHQALVLFNWRTLDGHELVSDNVRRVGRDAERYFDELQSGKRAWGLSGVSTDVGPATVRAVRDRSGAGLVAGVDDLPNTLDFFNSPDWG